MKFSTLVVDPPWKYRTKWGMVALDNNRVKRRMGYNLMGATELAHIDLSEYAEDNAHMYLWTTNAMMVEAHALMQIWGFEQKTIITWVKTQIGLGSYYRNSTEHVLFGVRGKLKTLRHDVPTHFVAPRTGHSEKPQAFYDMVETMSPEPRIDVFARKQRIGWHVAGNEVYSAIPELGAP